MKPILSAGRHRPVSHPLEATTVLNQYQRARRHERARGARARRKTIALALAPLAVAAVVVVVLRLRPTGPGERTIPLDAKARSEFVDTQGSKLSEDERRLLGRFLARLQTQESAGAAVPKLTVADAIERQRAYDREVGEAQKRIRERLEAAKSALGVTVREQAVVKSDPGKSASDRSLRYVLEIANRDKRTVDAFGLRVEFRDPSRKYVAAIPTLELKGPLTPGETGRSVQMLPLDPRYHQSIIEGGAVQINAYPTQVSYADGEKIDAESELKRLVSLAHAKIE